MFKKFCDRCGKECLQSMNAENMEALSHDIHIKHLDQNGNESWPGYALCSHCKSDLLNWLNTIPFSKPERSQHHA